MSFPLTSKSPPNCGEVSATTDAMPPIFIDSIFGFVPSSAFAYATTDDPFVIVTLFPDPETYLNVID